MEIIGLCASYYYSDEDSAGPLVFLGSKEHLEALDAERSNNREYIKKLEDEAKLKDSKIHALTLTVEAYRSAQREPIRETLPQDQTLMRQRDEAVDHLQRAVARVRELEHELAYFGVVSQLMFNSGKTSQE